MKTSSYLAIFSFIVIFLPVLPGATAAVTRPAREKVLNQARGLINQNRLAEAEALLEDLRTEAAKENNQTFEAAVLTSLGPVYERQANYQEAQNAYDQAIALVTESRGENAPELIQPIGKLATLLYESGQYSHAENLLVRQIGMLHSIGKPDKRSGMALAVLGKVYLAEHKYDPAERIANLGLLYVAAGTLEKAEPLLAEAHDRLESSGVNSAFRRGFLFGYADAERKLGHKKKAKELTKEGLSLVAKGPESSLSRDIVDASRYRQ